MRDDRRDVEGAPASRVCDRRHRGRDRGRDGCAQRDRRGPRHRPRARPVRCGAVRDLALPRPRRSGCSSRCGSRAIASRGSCSLGSLSVAGGDDRRRRRRPGARARSRPRRWARGRRRVAAPWPVLFLWPLALAFVFPDGPAAVAALAAGRGPLACVACGGLMFAAALRARARHELREHARARCRSRGRAAWSPCSGSSGRAAAVAVRAARWRCGPATARATPSGAGRCCGWRTARCCCRSGSAAGRSSRGCSGRSTTSTSSAS